jgi:CubicO group peptidase (beta-lactamase class C family)
MLKIYFTSISIRLSIFAFLITFWCGYSQELALKDKIEKLIESKISSSQISDFQFVVNFQNQIYRYDYVEGKKSLAQNKIFDLASLSKVFTGLAIMKLIEEKKINLNDHIQKYFPEYKIDGDSATIQNLLYHQSGYAPGLSPKELGEKDVTKIWKLLIQKKSNNDDFKYSDLNFIILGKVIEKVTGQKLDVALEHLIFKPLSLNSTSYQAYQRIECQKFCVPTSSDIKKLGKVHDPTSLRLGEITGHAGLFSTITDLKKLTDELVNQNQTQFNSFLRADTWNEMMIKSHGGRMLVFDSSSKYAAYPTGEYQLSPNSFGHTGFTGTLLWIDPEKKLSYILLTNAVYQKKTTGKQINQNKIILKEFIKEFLQLILNMGNEYDQ